MDYISTSASQARGHGGHSGAVPPQIVLFPEELV